MSGRAFYSPSPALDRVTVEEFYQALCARAQGRDLTPRQEAIINDRDCWRWYHRLPQFRAKQTGES